MRLYAFGLQEGKDMDQVKKRGGLLHYNSPATLTFALVSLLALLLGQLTNGASTSLLFCVYRSSLLDPLTYFRLFGHVLGHANWAHFSGNMMLLLVLGPMLEEKYGTKAIVKMIVLTALVSGLLYMLFFPQSALLGASGIVFMMIVLASAAGMKNGKIPITLLLVMAIYLGGEFLSGIGPTDGIAHGAHILGGLCGAGFSFFMVKKKS